MKLSKLCKRLSATAALALAVTVLSVPAARAGAEKQNLVQLISSSQSIVAGTVSKVTDGVDANGLPYTEVTIKVGISPKGKIDLGEYTFRQFGLLKPRKLANGRTLLMVTPEEFPKWHADEYVLAFLYHPAKKTGLQTTVGLAQGKLVKINDKFANEFQNQGLFDNIQVQPGALTKAEAGLLSSRGPVKSEDLFSLINHIVEDQMIERGVIK